MPPSNSLFFISEYEDDSKEEDAIKTYERVLKINPNHTEAQDALKNIKGLPDEAEELGIDLK